MKYNLLFLLAFLIVACSNESKNQNDSTSLKFASLEKVPQKHRELFKHSINLINSEIKNFSTSPDHSNNYAKFKAFLDNFNLELNKVNDKIYENEEFQKLAMNTPSEKINKALSQTGIMVTLAEGAAYLEPNISFFLESFKPYLSAKMQKNLGSPKQ
ncbi:MAG: hypothetical protein M0P71_06300 [Melioribacteraceae bacterium]|nr:hypothetical protein [Melioribacteraceae bacterium]